MPVIQECLHSPTETCGFNCWYFWNVGKSPAFRRREIAEARYGKVLAWQGMVNSTAGYSVEQKHASDEVEGSEALAKAFGSAEARGSQIVASEKSGQPGVVGLEEPGFGSSTRAEPANIPKVEFHGPEPEVGAHGRPSYPDPDHGAEKLDNLSGRTEADGIDGRVEGSFAKEELMETEDLDAKAGPLSIKMEGESLGEEAVVEDDEEWVF
ncbi:hypothetical protein VE03_06567 [Pseudogymnoascus sp. 23342-1-I1]|nr:hypothetical protein VE03_06567 [Pseudogymnoascus sp. 23342-1-I1]